MTDPTRLTAEQLRQLRDKHWTECECDLVGEPPECKSLSFRAADEIDALRTELAQAQQQRDVAREMLSNVQNDIEAMLAPKFREVVNEAEGDISLNTAMKVAYRQKTEEADAKLAQVEQERAVLRFDYDWRGRHLVEINKTLSDANLGLGGPTVQVVRGLITRCEHAEAELAALKARLTACHRAATDRKRLDAVAALVQDRHLVLDCSALELADHVAEALGLEGGLRS